LSLRGRRVTPASVAPARCSEVPHRSEIMYEIAAS
jgi:hypothetical protein